LSGHLSFLSFFFFLASLFFLSFRLLLYFDFHVSLYLGKHGVQNTQARVARSTSSGYIIKLLVRSLLASLPKILVLAVVDLGDLRQMSPHLLPSEFLTAGSTPHLGSDLLFTGCGVHLRSPLSVGQFPAPMGSHDSRRGGRPAKVRGPISNVKTCANEYSLAMSGLSAANISFYVATGAEIHWRQAHNFHGDKAAVKTLLTGLTGLFIVEIAFIAAAWFTTPHLYNWTKGIVSIFKGILPAACRRKRTPILKSYEQVSPEDWDEDRSASELSLELQEQAQVTQEPRRSLWVRVLIFAFAGFVVLLRCVRPTDAAYDFLSETVIVTPFDKGQATAKSSVTLPELTGDYAWLGNHTALAAPPKFDWLPTQKLPGFSDWYANANGTAPVHYDPRKDPIHISNLENEVLEPIRKAIETGNVSIKHVLLLKLESTRADVFPLRKKSFFGDIISDSYGGQIPPEVEERLATLTPTAERLTATASGFNGNDTVLNPYGGLHATNAYTADTFTLKSILATVCGVAPLVVDFNKEYLYHIYQPCMPHILEALNAQANKTENIKPDDYTTWPWRSTWMQSITDDYDNQDLLTPALGFKHKVTDLNIHEDYVKSGLKEPKKYNFWGYPERELEDYFRDAITNAEKNKERLFISHLTGITHHPWDTPDHEYEEMMSYGLWGKSNKVNRYLNTLGVADEWLALLLDILEETGVANETLVVMAGDQ
jgi:hypothetical protein